MNLNTLMLIKAIQNNQTLEPIAITGNPVAFITNVSKPLEAFTIPLSFTQSGSGDPSMTNKRSISGTSGFNVLRAKKNLAHIYGYSATNNYPSESGSLTNSYGTTISTTSADAESILITQSMTTTDYDKNSYQNGYFSVRSDSLVSGIRYDVSFKITNITNNPLDALLDDLMITCPGGIQAVNPTVIGNVVIFKNWKFLDTDSNPKECIEIRNCGMSFTFSEFMATAANTSDGIYVPYIGDSYNVAFPALGKNLFDRSTGIQYTTNNMRVARNQGQGIPFHLNGGVTYTFSPNCGGTVSQISLHVPYTSTGIKTVYNVSKLTYTPESDVDVGINMYWENGRPENATDIQIEIGDTVSSYEPYTCTAYGGSVDLVNGILTLTHFGVTKKISDYSIKTNNGTMTAYTFNKLTDLAIVNNNTQVCSIGKYSWNGYERTFDHFYGYTSNNADKTRLLLFLDGTSVDETQEFTAVFPLAAPYTIPLDPVVINTINGNNAISCSLIQNMSITYLKR